MTRLYLDLSLEPEREQRSDPRLFVEKSNAQLLEHARFVPTPSRPLSVLGNEDAPRKDAASARAGITDEMGLTVEGKKRRRREKERRDAEARERQRPPDGRFVPMGYVPRDASAKEFEPDSLDDMREGGRSAAADNAERAALEMERRRRAPAAIHDAMRVQRGK